ncbi:MAG: hypothetical protein HY832_00480 [Candidatus Aenigmarchaeota archaeon]|nr:hypothetical protein [Candidatus Aenigmarchaeota archaeon]
MILLPSKKDERSFIAYLEERFDVGHDIFHAYRIYAGPKGYLCIGPRIITESLRYRFLGVPIARMGKTIKPIQSFFTIFGNHVQKNSIALTKDQTLMYIQGNTQHLTAEQCLTVTSGAVMLTFQDMILGGGILQGNELKSLVPKAKRLDVKYL